MSLTITPAGAAQAGPFAWPNNSAAYAALTTPYNQAAGHGILVVVEEMDGYIATPTDTAGDVFIPVWNGADASSGGWYGMAFWCASSNGNVANVITVATYSPAGYIRAWDVVGAGTAVSATSVPVSPVQTVAAVLAEATVVTPTGMSFSGVASTFVFTLSAAAPVPVLTVPPVIPVPPASSAFSAARIVGDFVTHNGSVAVSSATANFTQADVGACLIVYAQAYSNSLNPCNSTTTPTIASVQDSQHATASAWFEGEGTFECMIGQDNFAALNAAYVTAMKADGTLDIPPGQYIFCECGLFAGDQTVKMMSGMTDTNLARVKIRGAGMGQTQLIPSPYLVPDPTGNGTPLIILNTNINWEGVDVNWLGITQSPSASAAGWGAAFTGSSVIRDSYFMGWTSPGGCALVCDSDDLMMDGVRSILNYGTALEMHSLNFRCVDCEFDGDVYGLHQGDLGCGKFTNCEFSGATAAMLDDTSGGGYDNVFVNCKLDGSIWAVQTSIPLSGQNFTPAMALAMCEAVFVGCIFYNGMQGSMGAPYPNNSGINVVANTTVSCCGCVFQPTGAGHSVVNAGTFLDGGGNFGLKPTYSGTPAVVGSN